MKYDFAFSWDSTYGHAARLVRDHADQGLVVDLGCGAAALSEPLGELGFEYLGMEFDPEAIERCRTRGISCEPIDLNDLDGARERIVSSVGERPVRVISLLDVIEHLVEPDRVMSGLASIVRALERDGRRPLLLVSIPNVAHADLGAKLIAGRWDVMPVGLLDDTHVTLFTEQRLVSLFVDHGFVEVGRDDIVIADSEQLFPVDHPAVARGATLSTYLRAIRHQADDQGDTYQFVRVYELVDQSVEWPESPSDTPSPLVSVVVRASSAGISADGVLACLAAQTDRDMEIWVVPSEAGGAVARGREFTPRDLAASIRDLVTVLDEPSVAAAMMPPLSRLRGRYVVFLDERDLVTEVWLERLRHGIAEAQGRCVRMGAIDATATPRGVDRAEPPPMASFDFVGHVARGVPLVGVFALPVEALRAARLTLDERLSFDLAVRQLIVRVVTSSGVLDRSSDVTIHRVVDGADADDPSLLQRWRQLMYSTFDVAPLLVPAGGASALISLAAERDHFEELHLDSLRRLDALERSRWWRLTAPLRWVAARRTFWR